VSAPKIHRVVGGSKGARQLMARQGRIERGPGQTPEQVAWNKRIDAERFAKKAKQVVDLAAEVNAAYDKNK